MTTPVIVLLDTAAGHIYTWHQSREIAQKFICDWKDGLWGAITAKDGEPIKLQSIMCSTDQNNVEWAVFMRNIIGMYIPRDTGEKTPSERIASAIEKSIEDGEDWKS